MAKPIKSKDERIKKLKEQDRVLARLSTIDKEKKIFSRGESLLKKLSVRKKVKFNPKMLSRPKKEQMKRLRSKVGRKSGLARRKRG